MTKKASNTRDFLWNAAGLTFNAFNSLFFLIAVKLINGIDEAGVWTYAFSLCCLFYVVALFFNRTYQVSDNRQDFCFRDYLAFREVSSGVSLVAIFVFCLASGFDWGKIAIVMLLMTFRVLEAISDCIYGEMQKNGELYKSGISLTAKAVVGFLAFLGVDLLTHNMMLAIVGLITVNVVIFTTYDLRQIHDSLREKVSISKENIRNLFRVTWPVFAFSLLSVFLANCQKYVMTYFTDNETQAVFGILIMPATMISLVGSYFINPFVGKLVTYKEQNDWAKFWSVVRKIIFVLCGIGVLGIAICAVIGIPLLNILYQMDFDEYWMRLNIIIIGAICYAVGVLLSSALTILDRNKGQVVIYGIVATVGTLSSLLLIPSMEISGATWSYLITSVTLVGGMTLSLIRGRHG